MPKAPPHFDADALLNHVHDQDYGLHVSTNDPQGFRRILYGAARKLGRKVHIIASPQSKRRFMLLKELVPGLTPLPEEKEDPDAESERD